MEELGLLVPMAGSLLVLAADGAAFTEDDEDVMCGAVKAIIAGWHRANDQRNATSVLVGGTASLVCALRGWDMRAGLYRIADRVVVVDPPRIFFAEGGGAARAPELRPQLVASFDHAVETMPAERTVLGELEIPSGSLLLAEAYQAAEDSRQVRVAVAPGRYRFERGRLACPWDPVLDAAHGLQMLVISRSGPSAA